MHMHMQSAAHSTGGGDQEQGKYGEHSEGVGFRNR
jgi:hypothetical protein